VKIEIKIRPDSNNAMNVDVLEDQIRLQRKRIEELNREISKLRLTFKEQMIVHIPQSFLKTKVEKILSNIRCGRDKEKQIEANYELWNLLKGYQNDTTYLMEIWTENVDNNLQFVKCDRCGNRIKIIKIRSPGRASQDRENIRKHLLLSCPKLNRKQKQTIKILMDNGMKKVEIIEHLEMKELQGAFLIMENHMKRQFPLLESAVKEYVKNISNIDHSSAVRIDLLGINKESIHRQIPSSSVGESPVQMNRVQNKRVDQKDLRSSWAADPSTLKRRRRFECTKIPHDCSLTDCNDEKTNFTLRNSYEEALAFTFENDYKSTVDALAKSGSDWAHTNQNETPDMCISEILDLNINN